MLHQEGRNVEPHKLRKNFREREERLSVWQERYLAPPPPPTPGTHVHTYNILSTSVLLQLVKWNGLFKYGSVTGRMSCHPAVRKDKVQLSMDTAIQCSEAGMPWVIWQLFHVRLSWHNKSTWSLGLGWSHFPLWTMVPEWTILLPVTRVAMVLCSNTTVHDLFDVHPACM